MTTKKYILIACGLLCLLSVAYGQKRETYFFSAEDMANIRSSAQTPWGKTIVDTLKSHIDERLKYPLSLKKKPGICTTISVRYIMCSLSSTGIVLTSSIVPSARKRGVPTVSTGHG